MTPIGPAQFEVNYETVTVKRDSLIKFSCSPKGDQPIQIDWFKETYALVPVNTQSTQSQESKYSEFVNYFTNETDRSNDSEQRNVKQRTLNLQSSSINSTQLRSQSSNPFMSNTLGLRSSELIINYADRMDTGNFICLARNSYGKDELTYKLIVQEAPDAPINLNAIAIQANSLRLSWTVPFDGNSPMTHIIVEYRKQQSDNSHIQIEGKSANMRSQREWTRLIVASNKLISSSVESQIYSNHSTGSVISNTLTGATSLSLIIRQLNARTNYQFRVATMNAIGQSSFSIPLSVSTAEEPPNGRAIDVRAEPTSSSSIKILWRAPAQIDDSAPIKGYHVKYRKEEPIMQQSGPISGEHASSRHTGWFHVTSISSNNVSNFNAIGQTYETRSIVGESITSNIPSYEVVLDGLEKSTKYEIRIQPFNSVGIGPAVDTISQTLKFDRPGKPHLKLVAARRHSFELRWSIGDQQPLMGFSLYYKDGYDEWHELQLGVVYQHTIEGLKCGTKYEIYMIAFNLVGRSVPSDVLNVRTEGAAPIAPIDKSKLILPNITHVTLDMTNWKSGGCPITNYMIQYKRLHDSKLSDVNEGPVPFASREIVPITNLMPATWYKLIIVALNDAGSTSAEYLFSTLTTEGEQIGPPLPIEQREFGYSTGTSTASHSVLENLNRFLWTQGGYQDNNNNISKSGGQQDLLVPSICLLFLLLSTLASYIYYNRAAAAKNKSTSHNTTPEQQNLNIEENCLNLNHSIGSNFACLIGEQHGQNDNGISFYNGPSRLATSASFVSGTELLRQQQHQHHQQQQQQMFEANQNRVGLVDEPVYQRLDNLQQYCLAGAHKQHQLACQLNPRSQTLRFNLHHHQSIHEPTKNSNTLHWATNQQGNIYHHELAQSNEPNNIENSSLCINSVAFEHGNNMTD